MKRRPSCGSLNAVWSFSFGVRENDVDTVAIENLSRFKPKGRVFNRKVMTTPFYLFRWILEGRCFDNCIVLSRVNSDHKASLAVAVKSLLERNGVSPSYTEESFQISGRRVPVSGLLRPSPMTRVQMAVPLLASGEGKATGINRW